MERRDWYRLVEEERAELLARLEGLRLFFLSDEAQELSTLEFFLIRSQADAMRQYLTALDARVRFITSDGG